MMKPVFDPGSGSGIPTGTDFAKKTTNGETTWSVGNLAVNTRTFEEAPNINFSFASASNNLYLRMEKTANGMEINAMTPDENIQNQGGDDDFWWQLPPALPAALEMSQNTEVKLYENNNVNFDAFKFVLTVREIDHNNSGLQATPQDKLRAPAATGTTPYPSDPQQVPWFSVTNTGDKAAYELHVTSFRSSENGVSGDGIGQTQNGANRIVECWGRAQGYADTLLVTYTIQAYANAKIS